MLAITEGEESYQTVIAVITLTSGPKIKSTGGKLKNYLHQPLPSLVLLQEGWVQHKEHLYDLIMPY